MMLRAAMRVPPPRRPTAGLDPPSMVTDVEREDHPSRRASASSAGIAVRAFFVAHARATLCLVAAAAFLPEAWQLVRGGIPDVLLTGDAATLELRVRLAAHGQQWLGPYSRLRWSHPGPAFFYLALPFYWLLRERGAALNVFELFACWACATSLVLVARRLRGDRFAFLLAMSLGVFERVAVPFAMSSEWNPTTPLLPLVLLTFLAARVALGGARWTLPAFVLVGSAIVQTHVGYLPEVAWLSLAASLGALGSGGLRWRWRGPMRGVADVAADVAAEAPDITSAPGLERPSRLWPALAAVAALLACWTLPVLENFTTASPPGNLDRLFTFFTTPHSPERTWQTAAQLLLPHVAEMPLAALRALGYAVPEPQLSTAAPPTSVVALALALVAVVVAALGTAVARRDRGLRTLAALALGQLAVALAAVKAIRGEVFPHLLWWTSAPGFTAFAVGLAWLTGGASEGRVASARRRAATPRTAAIPFVASAVLSVALGLGLVGAIYRDFGGAHMFGARDDAAEALAGEVERHLRSGAPLATRPRPAPPVVRILSADTWPTAMAVVLHLHKRGIPVRVAREWLFMVGPAFEPHPDQHVGLSFMDAAQHAARRGRLDLEPVAGSQAAGVYVDEEDDHFLEDHRVAVAAPSLTARGVTGDPARAIDGRIPENGTPWSSPLSVVLTSVDSSITVGIPARDDLVGAFVSVDGNDVYALRCAAVPGLTFFVGAIPPIEPAVGMQTRVLFDDALSSCRSLEVSPRSGDGFYSIGEIGFLHR